MPKHERHIALGATALAAVFSALLVLTGAAPGARAAVIIETSGSPGAWSVADADTESSLRCTYAGTELAKLTVTPPLMNGTARRKRQVGWQFQVWRQKWWMKLPDQWDVAYTSEIVKSSATKVRTATFSAKSWDVPAQFGTSYESLKVRLVMYWYGRNGVTEVGRTTAELEHYGLEQAGEPFDPAASTMAGTCAGSQTAPQPPAAGERASVPRGFVRTSHWRPYWKSFNRDSVQAMIDELTRMRQSGVVLMGVSTGNKYALPADIATYLQMLRDAGIQPYLAVWLGPFSSGETDTTVRAWDAGNGLWAGIVLDVEAGLMASVQKDRGAAVAAVAQFMARVKPMTPFLAYSTMAIPSDYPDMLYSELNGYSDVFMPQLYFQNTESALLLLDKLRASVDFESARWADNAKPMIPVVNDWGDGVDVAELRSYIDIAFARYGAVSAWRLHPNMHEDVKDVWGALDP